MVVTIILWSMIAWRISIVVAQPVYDMGIDNEGNKLNAENQLIKPSMLRIWPLSQQIQGIAKRLQVAYPRQTKILGSITSVEKANA